MNSESQEFAPIFHVDLTPDASNSVAHNNPNHEVVTLLRQLVDGQERQTELLEEIVDSMGAAQRQRANELGQWKQANPTLAQRCRTAAEALSQVQTEYLEQMTADVNDNFESMMDGEFMLNEFVDRYGPRLAHLNGVLQLLSQLSSFPEVSNSEA